MNTTWDSIFRQRGVSGTPENLEGEMTWGCDEHRDSHVAFDEVAPEWAGLAGWAKTGCRVGSPQGLSVLSCRRDERRRNS